MASTRTFNFQGMDLRNPMGDGLMYLQDAQIESYKVSRRPPLPTCYGSTAVNATTSAISSQNNVVCYRELNYTGTTDSWTFFSAGTFDRNTALYPLAGDGTTQVGVNTAYSSDGYESIATIDGQTIYAGSLTKSMAIWAGSGKTGTLNSTVSTRTASTTSGSNVVTFSGAVSGLSADWEDTYIYLSGFPKRPFRVMKYLSTTQIILDTIVDFTTASQTWCIQSHAWVGSINDVFLTSTGTSYNEVAAKCVEGHQSRLFAANLINGAITFPHRVYYTGTTLDANSSYKGVHNWYPQSYFDAAPELGNEVVAMKSFGGDLLIFKDKGIAVMRGVVANNDSTKFGARTDILSDEIRCIGPKSVVKTVHGVYLFSREGVYIVTGSGVDKISDPVWPWVRDNVDFAGDGSGHSFSSFAMDGHVYTDLGVRTCPLGETTLCRHLYLVWDIERNLWSIRTFEDSVAPSGVTEFNYLSKSYKFSSYKAAYTTSPQFLCFSGGEGSSSISPFPVLESYGDWPIFQLVTNNIVHDQSYPGNVRPVTVHVNAYNNDETSYGVPVLAIAGYGRNHVTTPFLGQDAPDGFGARDIGDLGDIDYELEEFSFGPRWQRFNVGSCQPHAIYNIAVVSEGADADDYLSHTDVYGIHVEYEESEVVNG